MHFTEFTILRNKVLNCGDGMILYDVCIKGLNKMGSGLVFVFGIGNLMIPIFLLILDMQICS